NYDAHTRVAREEVILREGIGSVFLEAKNGCPDSATFWFTLYCCFTGILAFGCLITKAPIVFERTMPYQIKFNALALVFWSSSDLGVLEARLGPQSRLITTGRILSTFGSVVYATACCAVAEFKPFLAYKMVIFGELFMSATTVLRSVAGAFIDFDVLPSDALEVDGLKGMQRISSWATSQSMLEVLSVFLMAASVELLANFELALNFCLYFGN
ncbi:hypothetical protein FOZ63_003512, partial [Perkinsus olseni]